MAGLRWKVEESVQAAKTSLGLDQHRCWTSWQRWTARDPRPRLPRRSHAHRDQPDPAGPIPLTVNEPAPYSTP
ncbi:hypothetical protein ACI2K4_29205 [Micromonospora sp. NPDC050397]|uniref:hypothetical protein n=1 Tax=Micromonospora sp. NPDC050397 TaxID=3364279 RepID=UPI00384C35C3